MAAKDAAGGVMSAVELKPLLRQARRRPMNCAIAMTKEKQGLILLDRRKKPRKVMAELRRQAAAAGLELVPASIRFGCASVDGASDSAMVTFTVNKPAPGPTRMVLLEQVRPAGFQRCEIVVDEALESEADDGEDQAEDDSSEDEGGAGRAKGGAAPAPAAAVPLDGAAPMVDAGQGGGTAISATPSAPGATGSVGGMSVSPSSSLDAAPSGAAMPGNVAVRSAPDGVPGTAPPDVAALRLRLTLLVQRVAGTVKSGQPEADALRAAANTAYGAFTSGNLAAAGGATDVLERLLGDAPADGSRVSSPVKAAPTSGASAPAALALGNAGTGQAARSAVATLTKSMTGLVRQIEPAIAAYPSCKAPLLKLATEAHACLKAGDAQAATTGIEALRQALSSPATAAGAAARPLAGKGKVPETAASAASPAQTSLATIPVRADDDLTIAASDPRNGAERAHPRNRDADTAPSQALPGGRGRLGPGGRGTGITSSPMQADAAGGRAPDRDDDDKPGPVASAFRHVFGRADPNEWAAKGAVAGGLSGAVVGGGLGAVGGGLSGAGAGTLVAPGIGTVGGAIVGTAEGAVEGAALGGLGGAAVLGTAGKLAGEFINYMEGNGSGSDRPQKPDPNASKPYRDKPGQLQGRPAAEVEKELDEALVNKGHWTRSPTKDGNGTRYLDGKGGCSRRRCTCQRCR
jgi:hypothetical protein